MDKLGNFQLNFIIMRFNIGDFAF